MQDQGKSVRKSPYIDHQIYYHKHRAFGVLLEEVTERTFESEVISFNYLKDDMTLKGSIETPCQTCNVSHRSIKSLSDRSCDDLLHHLDDEVDQNSYN